MKYFSFFLLVIAFLVFVYGTFLAIQKVNQTQTDTSEGTYTSYISSSIQIKHQAYTLTKHCQSKLCQVQSLLNFVTDIPYHTENFQRQKPQKTIEQNFGDCDDKSNLLISLLHALEIEAYFVLVPEHIFVIVPLADARLSKVKGLWVNAKKYYILESTAKGSAVGFALEYRLDEIDVIIEPFSNNKVQINTLEYKL